MKIKVCSAQVYTKRNGLNNLKKYIDHALKIHADILCLPEGYILFKEDYNEKDFIVNTQKLLKKNLVLILPICTKTENKLFILNKNKIFGKYNKTFLFADEKKRYKSNKRNTLIFNYKGFKISTLICYDIYTPFLMRKLTKKNVDLVIIPANLQKNQEKVWESLILTRCYESHIPIVTSCNTNKKDLVGGTMITEPDYSIKQIIFPYKKEGFLVKYLNLSKYRKERSKASPIKNAKYIFKQKEYGPFVKDFIKNEN